jgi:hypothetical protein
MGVLFEHNGVRILNLVDTVFHPLMAELSKIVGPAPDVILAPFQAGGYMCFLPLREGAPPRGLLPAIRAWSHEYLEELVNNIERLQPRLVVAFADGLAYFEKGINARHFPLPDSDFIEKLRLRKIEACSGRPGLTIHANNAIVKISEAASSLVEVFHAAGACRTFNIEVPLSVRPLSWYELPHGGLGRAIDPDWLVPLRRCMDDALLRFVDHRDRESMRRTLQDWHIEILNGDESHRFCCVWVENEVPIWSKMGFDAENTKYGVVCHGPDLGQVALGNLNLEAITLGGLFLYRSPEKDGDLERLRSKTILPLSWIFDV